MASTNPRNLWKIEGWYWCSAGWSAGCGLCCTSCIAVRLMRETERGLEGTWLEVSAGYSGESQKCPELEVVPLYNGCKLTGQLGKRLKLSSNWEVGNWQLLVMEHPAMLHQPQLQPAGLMCTRLGQPHLQHTRYFSAGQAQLVPASLMCSKEEAAPLAAYKVSQCRPAGLMCLETNAAPPALYYCSSAGQLVLLPPGWICLEPHHQMVLKY